RTGLPRHRTLRATMDWSYALLPWTEQVLLRRLAVFAGFFGLEAAEEICVADPLDRSDVLDGLAGLVDKSLAVVTMDGRQARYRLLETVRQYGLERMEEAEERRAVELRFIERYLRVLEKA